METGVRDDTIRPTEPQSHVSVKLNPGFHHQRLDHLGNSHFLLPIRTHGGGDCLFHALVGALGDFLLRHPRHVFPNDIPLPITHQGMRSAVVRFAQLNRGIANLFFENNHSLILETSIDSDSRSARGNNVIVGVHGGTFQNVDEYFEVLCCIALGLFKSLKSVPNLVFQIMLKEGSWGQHYEVMAAAAYFQVCIEVQQPLRPIEVAFYGRQEHTQFF